jgi:hypothetical protein
MVDNPEQFLAESLGLPRSVYECRNYVTTRNIYHQADFWAVVLYSKDFQGMYLAGKTGKASKNLPQGLAEMRRDTAYMGFFASVGVACAEAEELAESAVYISQLLLWLIGTRCCPVRLPDSMLKVVCTGSPTID